MFNFPNKRAETRFKRVSKLLTSLKECAEKGNDFILMYQGEIIKPKQIVISNSEIHVRIETAKTVSLNLVYSDEDYHRSIAETEQYVRDSFKLMKSITW